MNIETASSETKFLHEISTPLSIILFQLETSLKADLPTDIRTRLQQAFDQTKKVVASLEARRAEIK